VPQGYIAQLPSGARCAGSPVSPEVLVLIPVSLANCLLLVGIDNLSEGPKDPSCRPSAKLFRSSPRFRPFGVADRQCGIHAGPGNLFFLGDSAIGARMNTLMRRV